MRDKIERNRNCKPVVNLLISLAVFLLMILLVPRFLVFFMPFIIGWIISCIANPPVVFLERKLKIRRKAGTVMVIICTIAAVTGLGYLVFSILFRQLSGFITDIPEMWNVVMQDLNSFGNTITQYFGNVQTL